MKRQAMPGTTGAMMAPMGPPMLPMSMTYGNVKMFLDACPNGVVENSCTQDMIDSVCVSFVRLAKPETMAAPLNDMDVSTAGSRLLAYDDTNEGAGMVSSSGATLTMEMAPFTASSTTVDASMAGGTTSSNTSRVLLLAVNILLVLALLF